MRFSQKRTSLLQGPFLAEVYFEIEYRVLILLRKNDSILKAVRAADLFH